MNRITPTIVTLALASTFTCCRASTDALHVVPNPASATEARPGRLVAGSSRNDLWVVSSSLDRVFTISHYDGSRWSDMPVPVPDFEPEGIASAGAGAIWLIARAHVTGLPLVIRVNAQGAVAEDRSADLAATGGASLVQLTTGLDGTAYALVHPGASDSPEQVFRIETGRATHLIDLPNPGASVSLILGDNEIWIEAGLATRAPMHRAGSQFVAWDFPQIASFANVVAHSTTDVWVTSSDPFPSVQGGTLESNGGASLYHYDGSAWSAAAPMEHEPTSPGFWISRWGIVPAGPHEIAILETHFTGSSDDSHDDIIARRWDGTTLGAEHVIIGNAIECPIPTSDCPGHQAPVVARLLDGSSVHTHLRRTYSGSTIINTSRLLVGEPSDY